ncbi:hypothetical protein FBR05_03575 [Deltaproteobacteria bacterium PRO3]|nr:hypothetical protein [Deltaproteobacteria bacterium PRO3]
MTISLLKKNGEFFPRVELREAPSTPMVTDHPAEAGPTHPPSGALGPQAFRQPAVFRMDPRLRRDFGIAGSGGAAILAAGAVAMAIRREDIAEIMRRLILSQDSQEKKALLDGLFEEVPRDPYFFRPLLLLAQVGDPAESALVDRLMKLDLDAWKPLAVEDAEVLWALAVLGESLRHEGARQILRELDLTAYRGRAQADFGEMLSIAPELFLMAELGNPQAWWLLGEADVTALVSVLAGYRRDQYDLSDARLALEALVYVARSGGKNSYAAIEALRREYIREEWIANREAVAEVLGPLLEIGNESAREIAAGLDLQTLRKLPTRHGDPMMAEISLYEAIAVAFEYSRCSQSLDLLVKAAEDDDSDAMVVLLLLRWLGVAEGDLRMSALDPWPFKEEAKKQNLIEWAAAMLDGTLLSYHRSLQFLEERVRAQPGIDSLPSKDPEEIAAGILKAWRQEPHRDFYLRQEGKPMSLELIPSLYIEDYVERSLELWAQGKRLIHNGPVERRPVEVVLEKDRAREIEQIHIEMTLVLDEAFLSLPPEQRQIVAEDAHAAWRALSPSDREPYKRELPEKGPDALPPPTFLLAFHRSNSALFRPWSKAELGEEAEQDANKKGPKSFH